MKHRKNRVERQCQTCEGLFYVRRSKVLSGGGLFCSNTCKFAYVTKGPLDLTGRVFGRLIVIKKDFSHPLRGQYWFCQCECGRTAVVIANHLRKGKTSSCGCLGAQQRLSGTRKHGDAMKNAKHRYLYVTWRSHLAHIRAGNAGSIASRCYAGMPIETKWDDTVVGASAYPEFKQYILQDLGEKPTSQYSLDIIEHGLGFVPGNLRWADKKTQTLNRRHFFNATPKQILSRISDNDLLAEVEQRNLGHLFRQTLSNQ